MIKSGGIKNWSEDGMKIRTYFKISGTGILNVGLVIGNQTGECSLKISCGNNSEGIKISDVNTDTIFVGSFQIREKGYQFIEIEGLSKTTGFFPEISHVLIGGEATTGEVNFAKDDFYWGRRGPSVHLNFQVPDEAGDILYYYNEITVPENNDVLGSYFMANGFGQGYFGMQVNSETERRILFSVWSPFKTDDPTEIPEKQKIRLLKKGEGVHTGEFGNEGSGGQSYSHFMWKAGTTYKFLLKGLPTRNGETDFTAWFFAPEVGEWNLIASFRRPKTDSYLTRFHSFLENFNTETGNLTRKGFYTNQWVYNTKMQWIEITKMKFTADATARKNQGWIIQGVLIIVLSF